MAEAFWRPGQEYLLARYADRYLDLLPDLQYLPPLAAEQYARQLSRSMALPPATHGGPKRWQAPRHLWSAKACSNAATSSAECCELEPASTLPVEPESQRHGR